MYEISAHRKGINAMSRNDENNYTLRPLTIDDAEEYNALLRYAFQVTEQELAETGWKDDERLPSPNSLFFKELMYLAASMVMI